MINAPFKVVLDANVLYPFTLRDTLLRAADAGLFQVYWSSTILEEATRNLVDDGLMTADQSTRLVSAMRDAFPEALITGHEPLIAAMPNDEKDRHVAAAAVKIGAQIIVTFNLSDFAPLPEGLEAQHPDEFLLDLFDLDPDELIALVKAQAASLKKPPRTFAEVVSALAKVVPGFAAALIS